MLTARDIMTTEVVSVSTAASLKELAKIFVSTRYSNLPVVDEAGRLVGVISETDLVEQQKPLHIPTAVALFDWVFTFGSEKRFREEVDRVTASSVGELCQREPVTCSPDTSVSEIAGLMSEHKVHMLPVVEQERLVGVVARLDLIRTMEE
jgi:CBS domain-containing protein